MLNESISVFIDQGLQELNATQISFGLKFLVIMGVFYVFSMAARTGSSLIDLVIYVIAFMKWMVNKMRGKDV